MIAIAGPGHAGLTVIDQFNKLDEMKPTEIGAFDAKTRLSELLEQVAGGQTFVITRRGRPIAELRPIVRADAPRLAFGCDRTLVRMGADFDAPLADFAAYE